MGQNEGDRAGKEMALEEKRKRMRASSPTGAIDSPGARLAPHLLPPSTLRVMATRVEFHRASTSFLLSPTPPAPGLPELEGKTAAAVGTGMMMLSQGLGIAMRRQLRLRIRLLRFNLGFDHFARHFLSSLPRCMCKG
jgi:hypothetical protein